MHTTEQKLKERIKELTCLYEVTSLIVNCDYDNVKTALKGIVQCLKQAWQFDSDTYVVLKTGEYIIKTAKKENTYVFLESPITIFNKAQGSIKVGYPVPKYTLQDFLKEEQQLLDNICLEVGNLLERKEIKENEVRVRRQVEQSDRLRILGEITAGIAHELNTPMANILGFTELLKDRVKNDAQAVKDLDKIINNTIFSREVVKKLMFFACEMPQEKETVNIVPIIEDAIDLMRTTLRQNGVACKLITSKKSVPLRIDRIQLTQVLFNLIVNAVYFSPEESTILVEVYEETNKVVLKIADEGCGISPKKAPHIFEPFYTTKPIGEGSGLGLSVVHGIVQSHHGKISCTQNTPTGTIFTIEFPKE
ncbi:sensor histidine kinase [Costertonia aggregata]|uniref:histidine kinase n=1 Tax=Costertonia aggregata TaxID=343403 RepID=A0A7H9ANW1_9FLAO|nr:HAMP domain-containing sensor histidine kinase [Costertonia aggregata]QLG44955.1 HAMP domain-containing histidine kinase [Costertonia aggregata]